MPTPADELRASATQASAAFTLDSLAAAVAHCPLHQKTWIEIELVGEDGSPIADAPYRITLPDGVVQTGLTDAAGKARADGLPPGTCQVCFPGLQHDAWDLAATSSPAAST